MAGWVFFSVCRSDLGNGISQLLIDAVQFGDIFSFEHDVNFFVLCLILDDREQDAVLLCQFLKLSHVFALQGNNFQFFALPQQTVKAGFAFHFRIFLGVGQR